MEPFDPMNPLGIGTPSDDSRVRAAFEARGATSPATSRPLSELARLDPVALADHIDRGVVREGPAGRFYLYQPSPRRGVKRLAKTLLFWILIMLIPIFLIQLNK